MVKLKDGIMTSTQMDGMGVEKQLLKAVKHVLLRIMEDPHLAYYCGFGTQSLSLLTEAYANAAKRGVKSVREEVHSAIQKLDLAKVKEEREASQKCEELQVEYSELEDSVSRKSPSKAPIDGMTISELLEKITPIAADSSLPNLTRTNILNVETHGNYVFFQ
jgi:hypothetical protein